MSNRSYEYDLTQRLRSASKSPFTPRTNMQNYRIPEQQVYHDPVKTAEMHELQEEERYIHNIRKQIERIEGYKAEMDKKDIVIENLQDENRRLKSQSEDTTRLNLTVEELTAKSRTKDDQITRLTQQLQLSAQNYEIQVQELTANLSNEKVTNNTELKEFKKIIVEHERQNDQLKEELTKADKELKRAEEIINSTINKYKEKESTFSSQEEYYKSREAEFVCQITLLTEEKVKVEATSIELFQILQEVEEKMKHIPELEEELESEKQKTGDLESKVATLEAENSQTKTIGNEERSAM